MPVFFTEPHVLFFLLNSYTTNGAETVKYKIYSSTVPLLKSDKVIAIAIAAVSIESTTERVEANRSVST